MGIHNLHQILQKYSPNCYKTRHLSEFSERKIAVDISLYFYKFKAFSGERWLEGFLGLIQTLRKWNIHPTFVYDGKAPVEKFDEQNKRRQAKNRQNDKINELENEICLYEEKGEIGKMLTDLCYVKIPSLFRKEEQKKFNIELAKDKLKSLKNAIVSITEEDIQLTKDLFDILSIPYVVAPSEAECYASHMCVYGYVDAVLSEDTDVMVYKTPLFLSKIDSLNNTVIEIDYQCMIQELEFTPDMFTDMCIMCSCDYNTNIPLIGPEKSYSLIKTHHSIENVLNELRSIKKYTEDMFALLKYERCRELFTTCSELLKDIKDKSLYTSNPDFCRLNEFIFKNNIRYNLENFKKCTNYAEIELL